VWCAFGVVHESEEEAGGGGDAGDVVGGAVRIGLGGVGQGDLPAGGLAGVVAVAEAAFAVGTPPSFVNCPR
jgi:hypothetical protein